MIQKITFNNKFYIAGLLLLILFHFICNLAWINAGNNFVGHDVVDHLQNENIISKDIRNIILGNKPFWKKAGDSIKLLAIRDDMLPNWPHLTYIISGLFNFIFGQTLQVTLMSNMFFFVILILSIYGIGNLCGGPKVGLLSAILVSFYPNLTALSRFYGLDFPLTAFVALGIYTLIKTQFFEKRGWSILFGVVSGLGILTKGQYIFFVGLPAMYVFLKAIHRQFIQQEKTNKEKWTNHRISPLAKIYGPNLLNIFICLFIILAISSLWWGGNIKILLDDMYYHLFSSYYKPDTFPPFPMTPSFKIFTLGWFSFYLWHTIIIMSPVFFILFLISSILLWKKKEFSLIMKILFLWYLGSYFLFILISSQVGRYIFPAIPCLSIITIKGLQLMPKKIKIFLIAGILLFGLEQQLTASFGLNNSLSIKINNRLMSIIPNRIADKLDNTSNWVRKPEKIYQNINGFASTIKNGEKSFPHICIFEGENYSYDMEASWLFYFLHQKVPEINGILLKEPSNQEYFDYLLIPTNPQDEWLNEYNKWEKNKNNVTKFPIADWFLQDLCKFEYYHYNFKADFFLDRATRLKPTHFYLLSRKEKTSNIDNSIYPITEAIKNKLLIHGEGIEFKGYLEALGSGKNEYLNIKTGKYSSSSNRDPNAELEYLNGYIHTTTDTNKIAIIEDAIKKPDFCIKKNTLDFHYPQLSPIPGMVFLIHSCEDGLGIFFITGVSEEGINIIYHYFPPE